MNPNALGDVSLFLFDHVMPILATIFVLLVCSLPFAFGFGFRCQTEGGCKRYFGRKVLNRQLVSRNFVAGRGERTAFYATLTHADYECRYCGGHWSGTEKDKESV